MQEYCAECDKPWDGYGTFVDTGESLCKACADWQVDEFIVRALPCELCPKLGTCQWTSTDYIANAAGEDPETSMMLCELCAFLAAQVNILSSHERRMGQYSSVTIAEIGHLYGCLIDARHEDLASYHHDPQARKLISAMHCEGHNNATRFAVA